jgi:RNA polymerase sigma factor (sigma-70 family)
MATANLSDFFRRLTRGMAAATLRDHSDRQLVERALVGRDEAAFQAIVHRHGPMVYRVCWRVLQHPQDAEDAFQVTFLVLAQKLRAVRKHASLASWLHGVAHRVGLKAKAQSAARRRREHQASLPDALTPDDVTWGELRSALDFELSQLPDKWRLPLILCYLEGRTQDESASQLGWSKSTLRRRLDEARTALGCRLKRRSIVWPAALSAVLVSDCMVSTAPAHGLVVSTVEAAAGVAAGKTVAMATSIKVAALTEGVLKSMFLIKLRMATAVLFISLVTAGVGGLSYTTFATAQVDNRQEAQSKEETPEDVPDARLLLQKARDLDAARARHRQAEAIFKDTQKKLLEAQQGYEEAQHRYDGAKIGGRSKKGTTVTGTLVKVAAEENSVRLEYWKEAKNISYMAYETFPVAEDAVIMQDNVKTKLADLKQGSHITLKLNGKSAVRISVDGGIVGGPIRYVSADEARNTIAVIAGRKEERRVYHLVKETEVKTARGRAARVKDLKEGTLLLLTRSVADTNTVIRIETLPPDKAPPKAAENPPRRPKKLARLPDPSPELRRELSAFDAYRHGSEEKFAELDRKADELLKRFTAREDQARIHFEMAHVAGQSDIRYHVQRVQAYARKSLALSRDPLQRGWLYSYLGSAAEVEAEKTFANRRQQAAEELLTGYVEMCAQELPEKAPELPPVDKIGGEWFDPDPVVSALARARHTAQVVARQEAEFLRALVHRRDTLANQLRWLYRPDPRIHGRNPDGPQELRALARKVLHDPKTVDALLARVTAE